VINKIFEKIIVKEINDRRENLQECRLQYGFRRGKSTEDAINEVCGTINILKQQECKYAMGIFFDIAGAFDNVWWPSMLKELKHIGVHPAIWKTIKSYFQGRTIQVNTADGVVLKNPTKGCPQGSVLGPIIWDMIFQPCLGMLNELDQVERVVGYADDLAVVIKGNNRNELQNKANQIIDRMTSWCNNNKLTISAQKTKYVLFKGNLNFNRGPIIKINGKTIKREREFKYLGVILDEKLNFRTHVTTVKNKAVKLSHKIVNIATKDYRIPLRIVRMYHDVIIRSVVGYAASAWGHRMDDVRQQQIINRSQRQILLRLTGAYRTTPVEALQVATATMPMHLQVKRMGAAYWLRKEREDKIEEILHQPAESRSDIQDILTSAWQSFWEKSSKARRVYSIFPDVAERAKMQLEIEGGLLHFVTGHGPYRQRLKDLKLVEDNMCHACGVIASPDHVVLRCQETEDLVREQRAIFGERPVTEVLRTPELVPVLRETAEKVSSFYKIRFLARGAHLGAGQE